MGRDVSTSQTLEARIATALVEPLRSDELRPLITEAKRAAAEAGEAADEARDRALDPRLASIELGQLRHDMDSAAFRRDRLENAIPALKHRLEELRSAEEDQKKIAVYDRIKAERDALAAELRQLYPKLERQLCDLLERLASNNAEITQVNRSLPSRRGALLQAELVARELQGFRIDGMSIPSVVDEVRLPRFKFDKMNRYVWPLERRPRLVGRY